MRVALLSSVSMLMLMLMWACGPGPVPRAEKPTPLALASSGAVSTDALGRLGLAQNREDRVAFNLGVRHGFF